jgi:hypothetical protein
VKSQGESGQHDDDQVSEPEITWVGEQRLMEGYCGRAQVNAEKRPVAVVRTRAGQGRVVRIGPPREAAA